MRIEPSILKQCWYLAGPTACGKTEVGLCLAERLGAEILALDSMTVYRGMEIGTAKPTAAQRQRVPHHLLDLVDPSQEFTTADYLLRAEQACREVLSRGRVPLFVGGTGLYLRSVLRGVCEAPPADWEFRKSLEAEAERSGKEVLHQRLFAIDPSTAMKLHPQDLRRVIRALEIEHLTQQPASEMRREEPLSEADRPPHLLWLSPPRERLQERINQRVEAMLTAGLVTEVQQLLQQQPPPGRTALQALGYKEIVAYLQGESSLPSAIEQIKTRTRQFAKRQETWFRNLVECRPFPVDFRDSPDQLAERILSTEASGGR